MSDPAGFLDDTIAFITSDLARDVVVILPDTELLLEGVVDSLGLVRLVEWIETSQGIEIDPTELVFENFSTPAVIAAFVARLHASN